MSWPGRSSLSFLFGLDDSSLDRSCLVGIGIGIYICGRKLCVPCGADARPTWIWAGLGLAWGLAWGLGPGPGTWQGRSGLGLGPGQGCNHSCERRGRVEPARPMELPQPRKPTKSKKHLLHKSRSWGALANARTRAPLLTKIGLANARRKKLSKMTKLGPANARKRRKTRQRPLHRCSSRCTSRPSQSRVARSASGL